MNDKSRNQKSNNNTVNIESITKRLDVLIRLYIETILNKNEKFTLTGLVKTMKSSGLDRKEIADILGKKPTDIDPLLYSGKKSKDEQSVEKSEGADNIV